MVIMVIIKACFHKKSRTEENKILYRKVTFIITTITKTMKKPQKPDMKSPIQRFDEALMRLNGCPRPGAPPPPPRRRPSREQLLEARLARLERIQAKLVFDCSSLQKTAKLILQTLATRRQWRSEQVTTNEGRTHD
jgi:hypothetical protein